MHTKNTDVGNKRNDILTFNLLRSLFPPPTEVKTSLAFG